MNKIAFIGVGIMGRSMVRNLMKAGFELHIYARTRSKVEDVISEGATFHDTIADCVKDAEAVITIVGFPTDVEEVYFDAGNILESAKEGTYLIDMTTTSPMLDQKIAEEGTKRGFHVLDAPVTGGDTGAKNGTLSILVGGSREDYEACMPLFEAMGTNINYQGGSGCGQHAKLANQIMIAGGRKQAVRYLRTEDSGRRLRTGILPEALRQRHEDRPYRSEHEQSQSGRIKPGACQLRTPSGRRLRRSRHSGTDQVLRRRDGRIKHVTIERRLLSDGEDYKTIHGWDDLDSAEEEDVKLFVDHISVICLLYNMFFKKECFAQEQEYRMVFLCVHKREHQVPENSIPVEYRIKDEVFIPFIRMKLGDISCLKFVCVGTKNISDLAVKGLRHYFGSRDLEMRVKKSEIPLRY